MFVSIDMLRPVYDLAHRSAVRAGERAVRQGVPPSWLGWRWVREETVDQYVARTGSGRLEVIHAPERTTNPLPRNIVDVDDLPSDPDWFGYAFHDVPTRISGRTAKITLHDATVVTFKDAERDRFWPAVLTEDGRSLSLREVKFRPGHSRAARTARAPARRAKATWFLERVYDNHSHWLTAHLPKLCLLKDRGELADIVLPERRNGVIDASLEILGIDPARFTVHDPSRPLRVDELTLLETDRFRPQLLRRVRDHMGAPTDRAPWRRVFITRSLAKIRRLSNESDILPMLEAAGFQVVAMEALDFHAQIRLMSETRVLLAPHGAGLTNMMFCQPGAQVIEIADTDYPNPNFYALACAMELGYWLVRGHLVPEDGRHRLDLDLSVDPERVRRVLQALGDDA